MMSLHRFARLLEGRGADLVRWPAAERAAAEALLAGSPPARRLLAEARALDALLRDGLPSPDPDAAGRVRAAVARRVARLPRPAPPSRGMRLVRGLRSLAPAGCGALAAVAACAAWLALAPPLARSPLALPADPVAPLQALPVGGEAL
jgi:hypothetical protein